MIKFDKVTLEPKFIDPSMCFCGGGGGGGGGGAPQEPRGTVFGVDGVSKTGSTFDDRAIGFTDDRGGRGANYESLRDATASQTRAAVDAARAKAAAEFDAYGDLDRRATVGQMPNLSKGFETPLGRIPTPTSAVIGAVNRFGMSRARDIRDKIDAGGVPVKDKFGRIQGVVSQGTGPVAGLLGAFGQNTNVYTGSPSFAPATSEQLMSYRPLSQGLGSFDPAIMPPSDMRRAAQSLSQPTTSAPEIGSIINVDNRNFLVTEKGPVELKGTAEQEVISSRPSYEESRIVSPNQMYGALTGQLAQPLTPFNLEYGLEEKAPQNRAQLQNVGFNIGRGPFTEDPAVVAERNRRYEELMDNIGAAARGEPLPSNENMYGRGMQDLGDTLIPAQLGTYQDSSLSPQYGTINDPTAQAGVFDGIGEFFTETLPGVFDYSAPAKAKSNADRFKGSRVRTKPTGVGEYGSQIYEAAKNLFTG